jgi:hypothetical protein
MSAEEERANASDARDPVGLNPMSAPFVPFGVTPSAEENMEHLKSLLTSLKRRDVNTDARVRICHELQVLINTIAARGNMPTDVVDVLIPLDRQKLSGGLSLELLLEDRK